MSVSYDGDASHRVWRDLPEDYRAVNISNLLFDLKSERVSIFLERHVLQLRTDLISWAETELAKYEADLAEENS